MGIAFYLSLVSVFFDQHCILNHWWKTYKGSKSSTCNLWYQAAFAKVTLCLIPYLYSVHFPQVRDKFVRTTSIAILKKIDKIIRKAPMIKSFFSEVASFSRTRHVCFSVNVAKNFKTFLQSLSWRLLLPIA